MNDNNSIINYKENYVLKGKYKVIVTFSGDIQHATKCDWFTMEYEFIQKSFYEKLNNRMLSIATSVKMKKIDDIG